VDAAGGEAFAGSAAAATGRDADDPGRELCDRRESAVDGRGD
jgi:hypothetical protein